jgi:DNA-binding NarL/FixJ family response regulator
MGSAYALPAERTSVYIAAEDPVSRAGAAYQLRSAHDLRVVSEDQVGPDTVALVIADEVDDLTAQGIRSLRARGVERIVLLVTRVDDQSLLLALEAGVGGVLKRSQASVRNITASIAAVAAGEGMLPPDMLGRLLDQVGRLQRQVLAPRGLTIRGLTEREVSVLRLLAEGLDTAEVGKQLFYSERTVKNIVHDITSRLELRNRTHAVAFAIKQGLI